MVITHNYLSYLVCLNVALYIFICNFLILNLLNQRCMTTDVHTLLIGINEYSDPTLSVQESLMDTFRIDYHYRHLYYLRSAIE